MINPTATTTTILAANAVTGRQILRHGEATGGVTLSATIVRKRFSRPAVSTGKVPKRANRACMASSFASGMSLSFMAQLLILNPSALLGQGM
jgi:hypothetical protein